MSDTVNVDTLVEQVGEVAGCLARGATYPEMEMETLMELVSDLAARARQTESQDWYTEWYEPMKRRAGAAEADRDRLARRVTELDTALRQIASEVHGSEKIANVYQFAADALAGDGGGA